MSLYHTEIPGEGPPIVLLHGSCLDHRVWGDLIGESQWQRPLITLDLPGQGLSMPWPGEGSISIDVCVEEVAKLVGSFDSPVSIIGHSQGALVGLRVASEIPDRVSDLCLIGLLVSAESTEAREGLLALIDAVEKKGQHVIVDQLMAIMFSSRMLQDPEQSDRLGLWRSRLAEPGPEIARALLGVIQREDAWQWCDKVGCPVLLLYGELDERADEAERQRAVGLLRPEAFVELAGVGHTPQLECPSALSRIIQQFYARRRDASG